MVSNSRAGEGAVYQSIFYPYYNDANCTGLGGREVAWAGEVRAILVDAFGNMRADTNQNAQLDLGGDLIIEFNAQGLADLWRDVDADGQLEKDGTDSLAFSGLAQDDPKIKYLWRSSTWLNEIDDVNILMAFFMQPIRAGLTGDRHQGSFIQMRIGNAGQKIGRARSQRRQADGCPAGQPALDVAHEGRALLMARGDELQAAVQQDVDEVEILLPGYAEDEGRSFIFQTLHE